MTQNESVIQFYKERFERIERALILLLQKNSDYYDRKEVNELIEEFIRIRMEK